MPGAWLCAGWRGALRAGAAGASPGGSPPPCGLTVRVTCSLPPRPVSRARPSRGTARGERGAGSPQVWTRSPPRAPGRLSGAPGRGVPEQLRAEDRRAAVRPTLGGLGGLTIWRNARAALFSVRGSGRGPAALVGSQPWPPLGLFPARGTAWPGLCSQLCLTPEGKGMERLSYLPGVPRLGGNRIRSHTCLLSNPRSFPLPRACPSFVEQLGSPRPPPRPPGVTARTQGGGRLPRFPCAERRGPELQGKGAPGLEGQAPSCSRGGRGDTRAQHMAVGAPCLRRPCQRVPVPRAHALQTHGAKWGGCRAERAGRRAALRAGSEAPLQAWGRGRLSSGRRLPRCRGNSVGHRVPRARRDPPRTAQTPEPAPQSRRGSGMPFKP